jgi:Zn-dependent protease with chaperone function
VAFAGLPPWFPAGFALVMVGVQYLVNPLFIQWLVPAVRIPHDGQRYLTEDPIGELVARRCTQAGVPLVVLGVVDDGTPNAFTFGRTPRDARMWITRGLIERLDEDELDAVIAHEVGHIRHWDFAVMTVAAAIPLTLYFTYLMTRRGGRQVQGVAVVSYLAYLLSQFVLLALSRARELAADHWSCEATEHGDALASALVKVAYGMGQAQAEQKSRVAALVATGKEGKKEAARLEHRYRRAQSLHALGIFDGRQAAAMETALSRGIAPDLAVGAMRWDLVSPWGATLEKVSSHPLVARRIQALEESGLPGAPRAWSTLRAAAAAVPAAERARLRVRYVGELALAVAPWALLASGVLTAAWTNSAKGLGVALVAGGSLLIWKQLVRYPTGDFEAVFDVASLHTRLDAGPVRGIPVDVRGEIIGRGFPGYVLSPDLVVSDASGFVPLLYRQPIPFARAWFGLTKVRELMGEDVIARGWYRRTPSPVIEIRTVTTVGGRSHSCWEWTVRYAGAALVVLAGLIVLAASAS